MEDDDVTPKSKIVIEKLPDISANIVLMSDRFEKLVWVHSYLKDQKCILVVGG